MAAKKNNKEIFFGKDNYILIGVGLLIVVIGFFLMAGGENAPDEWNEDQIYSFTRITLAPFIVLCGLGVVVYSIFKDNKTEEVTAETDETAEV